MDGSAQEVITPSAGYFETQSISLNWTIGETAIETYINNNIMLTQGFNQADLTFISSMEELSADICLTVYPNPVKDFFTIKAETDSGSRLKAEVYDLEGIRLITQNVNQGITQINTEGLTTSEYILKIYDNRQLIKSFKFIKTN
jgi:hypothetical protein